MAMFTTTFLLQLLLLSLLFISTTSSSHDHHDQHLSNTIGDEVCSKVNCGKGTCVPELYGLLFRCECDPGWKAIQIGPFTFPSCVVPNCTMNFTCGSGAQTPPVYSLPPLNFSSPCNLVWCGDGTCVVNGTGHYCQCNHGSANLLNNPAFVCLRQCYLGADCHNLGADPQPPPGLPPSISSGSSANGPKEASNCWRALPKLIITIITTMFLPGF